MLLGYLISYIRLHLNLRLFLPFLHHLSSQVGERWRHLPDGGQCHGDASDAGALIPLPVPPGVAVQGGPDALAGAENRPSY